MSHSPSLEPGPGVHTATAAPLAAPSLLAQRLGYAGLLPFVLGALLVWIVLPEAHPYVTAALSAYAAVVLAMLGGIHWGLAMRQADAPAAWWLWGVTPPLLAGLAMLMLPASGLVIHGLLLLACYAVDRRLYPAQGAAAWLTLRFRLSAVAALSCFFGAAGA